MAGVSVSARCTKVKRAPGVIRVNDLCANDGLLTVMTCRTCVGARLLVPSPHIPLTQRASPDVRHRVSGAHISEIRFVDSTFSVRRTLARTLQIESEFGQRQKGLWTSSSNVIALMFDCIHTSSRQVLTH
jgi:hypothetical protein